MIFTKKASGIIEAMVVILLLVTGIVWVYTLLISSQRLATSTSLRIEAIQIARDWLEAVTNIRDTNWILFWGDIKNCWNTLNYNNSCIGDTTKASGTYMTHSPTQSFILYRDLQNRFIINTQPRWTSDFSDATYRNRFSIKLDGQGFYTQTGSVILQALYTREIRVDYLNAGNVSQWSNAPNNPKIKVSSIVQWQDPARDNPVLLEMSTILTNWKDRN